MPTRRKRQPLTSEAFSYIETGEVEAEVSVNPNTISIDQIELPEYQPRQFFDPQKLEELAQSIKRQGILEPLIVRILANEKYELIAGGRRYRAAQMAGLQEVPVVVKELSDQEALAISIVENLQREDLNPVEETQGILRLLGLKLEMEVSDVPKLLRRFENESKGKVTHNVIGSPQEGVLLSVFEGLSITWQSFVSNRLPILDLPSEILEVLHQGKIAYTKATAIAKVKDTEARAALLAEAIDKGLSLAQIKERIEALKKEKSDRKPPKLSKQFTEVGKKADKLPPEDPRREKIEKLLAEVRGLLE